ncbi:hypothetical protein [Nostoc sp. FACHB-190]|uniref:hypothetical protein n=1 Tax=Nostoc sp. FACHB-190 TaxID=2692838 RepID=UPI001687C874|nr:hypothetical protein [Nostoc sp. FACHB-190]MBD2303006.1 hypothetical protein [Nostoc sp. FACHB-190]
MQNFPLCAKSVAVRIATKLRAIAPITHKAIWRILPDGIKLISLKERSHSSLVIYPAVYKPSFLAEGQN